MNERTEFGEMVVFVCLVARELKIKLNIPSIKQPMLLVNSSILSILPERYGLIYDAFKNEYETYENIRKNMLNF